MKKILLAAAIIAVSGAMTELSAQISTNSRDSEGDGGRNYPLPHKKPKPNKPTYINAFYDSSTTVLTVNFPQNSNGGTVEVLRNGAKVAGITAGGGTTFSCRLKDYGVGDYNIIVSRDNTVVYSKNITVR